MKFLSNVYLLYMVISGVHALPKRAAVTQAEFNQLAHYAQWAAAAYCDSNLSHGNTSTAITCAAGNCPDVEKAKAESVFEWKESASDTNIYDDVPGFVAIDPTNKEIIVSIRGTVPQPDNIITDISFPLLDAKEFCSNCQLHGGFYAAWTRWSNDVVAAVQRAQSSNPGFKIIVTGHSLGGAVATIAAATLHVENLKADLYTYGAARAGNDHFAAVVTNSELGVVRRVTHLDDPIPHLPPAIADFRHPYPEYWLGTGTDNQTKYTPADVTVCQADPSGNDNSGCANSETAWYSFDFVVGLIDPTAGLAAYTAQFVTTLPAHHHYFQQIDSCAPGAGFQ